MKLDKIREWTSAANTGALENAWLEAMEAGESAAEMAGALELAVKAGMSEQAQAWAQMLVEDRIEGLGDADALELIKPLALAVPAEPTLRARAATLYRKLHGDKPNFDAIFNAAGLAAAQSNRRAFRTLDICLSLKAGQHVVNRFDNRVLCVEGFDQIMAEFTLRDSDGRQVSLDPKALADEFEPVGPSDFRVLTQLRKDQLGELLKNEPATVLIGICQTRGGSIDANELKEMLVPAYMPAGSWSSWWSSARNAARKCPNLAVESSKPIVVTWHEGGLTLEEELASAAAQAKGPLAKLALLGQYVREAQHRKLVPQASFTGKIVTDLAAQTREYLARRPADALAAALALQAAAAMGVQMPADAVPTPADVLTAARHKAKAVAEIDEPSVWPAAVDALASLPNAGVELAHLLKIAPTGMLDLVAQRLAETDHAQALADAVAAALAKPTEHLNLFLWLYKGPEKTPPGCAGVTELLDRLLKAVGAVDRDWDMSAPQKKDFYQRVRNAISARDYGRYRQAIAEMDEAVAGTIKRLIERSDGLAEAVRGDMLAMLRENHYNLFAKTRIEPWLDENIIWSTEQAIHRREDELKELTDVKMLENSRAIGAAAALGDLSENSEWKFAVEEQRMLKARSAKMQEELSKARVIRADEVAADTVGVGVKVTLRRQRDGHELSMSFLGPWDIDLENNVYSYQTGLAQELMGKALGQSVDLALEGTADSYTIEAIAPAVQLSQ